jgi:glycosyltransferase involved in cell wall biosynthesis
VKKPSVLFLLPYPIRKAPSQRFRVELYFRILEEEGIHFRYSSFVDEKNWEVIYKNGQIIQKLLGAVRGFIRRFYDVFVRAHSFQYIFVHREAAPIGPPVFEWLLTKIFRKKLIFDFDDAIWIPNTSAENKFVNRLKCFWKVSSICKWSYKISAGNEFLCNYARQNNPNVVYLPTCVDIELQHNAVKEHKETGVTIGWTGSHSTMKYLNILVPVFQRLEKQGLSFVIISDKAPDLPVSDMRFIKWSEQTEIQDLMNIDIGLMPLETDPWAEGKCGFKLIQYLSLGIPAVATPVGVNSKILQNGANGYLASTGEEWYQNLQKLAKDLHLRQEMGNRGRKFINEHYSIQANKEKFINLFT